MLSRQPDGQEPNKTNEATAPAAGQMNSIANVNPADSYKIPRENLDYNGEIGRGSFGIVYKVFCKVNDQYKTAAVKEQSINKRQDKERIEQEMNVFISVAEAQKKNQSGSENLVKFYGHFELYKKERNFSVNYKCLVMEYIANGSLSDWIFPIEDASDSLATQYEADNGITAYWNLVSSMIINITRGLDFLHKLNFVHCDLKPQNILLTADLQPKICDYGLTLQEGVMLTHFTGSPLYGAPEMISITEATPTPVKKSMDIPPLGFIFWMFSAKKEPNSDIKTLPELIATRVVKKEWETIPATCPDKIAHLIKWCWENDPAKRPNTSQILSMMKAEELTANQSTDSDAMTLKSNSMTR